MNTEDSSACVTVNCKACRSAIALYRFSNELNIANISSLPIKTSSNSEAYPYTWQYIVYLLEFVVNFVAVLAKIRIYENNDIFKPVDEIF
jgi:hypothetical protein